MSLYLLPESNNSIPAPTKPSTVFLEKFKAFKPYDQSTLVEGETWYAFDSDSWNKNFEFIFNPQIEPSTDYNIIDNSKIIDKKFSELISTDVKSENLKFIHEDDYRELEKYCLIKYSFPRKVVARPPFGKEKELSHDKKRLKIETHPILVDILSLVCKIDSSTQLNPLVRLLVSKHDKLNAVINKKFKNDGDSNQNQKEELKNVIDGMVTVLFKLEENGTLMEIINDESDIIYKKKKFTLTSLLSDERIKSLVPINKTKLASEFSENNYEALIFVLNQSAAKDLLNVYELIKMKSVEHPPEKPQTPKTPKKEEEQMDCEESVSFTVGDKVFFLKDKQWVSGHVRKIDSNFCFVEVESKVVTAKEHFENKGGKEKGESDSDSEEESESPGNNGGLIKVEKQRLIKRSNEIVEENKNQSLFNEVNEKINEEKREKLRGKVGLNNLGHTCFMNSILQCLSNCEDLTEYFLSEKYLENINKENPLGCKGMIAEKYGALMKELWDGAEESVSPISLKYNIGNFAPRFNGFVQQDSSELLFFLLDGLHEDLNLVTNKPYIEESEIKGKTNNEIAEKSWKRYLQRNKSIIVDLFQGQIKSTLVCPSCNYVSVIFDPFLSLSLQLPDKKTRVITLFVVPLIFKNKNIIRISVKVLKTGDMKDLKKKVAESIHFDIKRSSIFEYHNHGVYRMCEDYDLISGIDESDHILLVLHPPSRLTPEIINEMRLLSIKENNLGGEDSNDDKDINENNGNNENNDNKKNNENDFSIDNIDKENKYEDKDIKKSKSDTQKESIKPNNEEIKNEETNKDNVDKVKGVKERILKEDGKEEPKKECKRERDDDGSESKSGEKISKLGEKSYMNKNGGSKDNDVNEKDLDLISQYKNGEIKEGVFKVNHYAMVSESPSDSDDPERERPQKFGVPGILLLPLGIPLSSKFIIDEIIEYFSLDPEIRLEKPRKKQKSAEQKSSSAKRKQSGVVQVKFFDSEEFETLPKTIVLEENKCCFRIFWIGKNEIDFETYNCPIVKELNEDPEDDAAEDTKKVYSLEQCLNDFCTKETLTEQNTWFCQRCKDHKKADKKLDLWRLPKVVIIHLKRFQQHFNLREKIDLLVNFPVEGLDLSRWLAKEVPGGEPALYDLFAVSNHYGVLRGGHYTAFCKHAVDGKWYVFDDSSVVSFEESFETDIVTANAYVLFYKRRGCEKEFLKKMFVG